MTLNELKKHIEETYGVEGDHPFPMDDVSCVYRHPVGRKWFAITMNVPYRTLGIDADGAADIVNVKCDPLALGSFRENPGFLPAYHMNKQHWVTVLLDGSAQREQVAAQALAEAERIKVVTVAKANAEAMEQAGIGIAAQRRAIADGIAKSIDVIRQSGVATDEANELFLFTQWTDMMESFAKNGKQSTIVLPSNFSETASMFDILLGDNLAGRKEYITLHGNEYIEELDVS